MKQRILLKGKAGLDLLHRISSINVHALKTGFPAQGLILNPEGRILSLFEITLQTPDIAAIGCDPAFAPLLDRYTFSEHYVIEPLPDSDASPESEADRILALAPKEGHEFELDGKTNPLEVNLRHAISDQKGCYPGQEVIEKIIAIGSPARRLCLLELKDAPVPEKSTAGLQTPLTLVSAEGHEVGVLTSLAGNHALGIVRRTHLKEGVALNAGGLAWTIVKVSS
jgi:folate-binding protein YgfZ